MDIEDEFGAQTPNSFVPFSQASILGLQLVGIVTSHA